MPESDADECDDAREIRTGSASRRSWAARLRAAQAASTTSAKPRMLAVHDCGPRFTGLPGPLRRPGQAHEGEEVVVQ